MGKKSKQSKQSSQAIIITGMHRSGTSLVASLLQSAGVHIGGELLSAKPDNPHGYFEDVVFCNFHDKVLTKRGLSHLVTSKDPIYLDGEEMKFARKLIKSKSSQPIWGWKNPRTSLFLDFWYQLLPSAKFLFVYRHPVEVLLSLLKRLDNPLLENPLVGLQSWEAFNERILKFTYEHPDQSTLCHINGILQRKEEFNDLLHTRLGLTQDVDLKKQYHSESLHHLTIPNWLTKFIKQKYPEILELYEQLQREAHLSFKDPSGSKKISNKEILSLLDYIIDATMTVQRRLVNERKQLLKWNQQAQKNNQLINEQNQQAQKNNQRLQEQNQQAQKSNQRLREQNQKLLEWNQRALKNNQRINKANKRLLNQDRKLRESKPENKSASSRKDA